MIVMIAVILIVLGNDIDRDDSRNASEQKPEYIYGYGVSSWAGKVSPGWGSQFEGQVGSLDSSY